MIGCLRVAASEKTTHFGRAGEYFAMSEFLLRGWNVAVPVVDLGDDVFVINDNDKTTWRVQVKSAQATRSRDGSLAHFNLSRTQLARVEDIELFYMMMIRDDTRWRYLVIPREKLYEIHSAWLSAPREGRGRRPVSSARAKTDTLRFDVVIADGDATAWNASMTPYLDSWPSELPVLAVGPGSKSGLEP
jgi:hypothetical protein